jgi:hypothetical protein
MLVARRREDLALIKILTFVLTKNILRIYIKELK